MKRLVLTVTGTIAGCAALLSVKTHSPVTGAGALPSAGLAGGTARTASPATSPAASPSSGSTASSAHAYLGSAVTTRYGVVQVRIDVTGHTITDVAFAQLTAFDPHSQQIDSWAGPQLLRETLSAQSAQVDTVSGASYTSDGYRRSLQSALDRAGW